MAAVRARHQLEDGVRLPVLARAEHNAGVGPFHQMPASGGREQRMANGEWRSSPVSALFAIRHSLLAVFRKLQSHLAEALGVVAPLFPHLDEQKEMYRLLDQLRDL